MSVVLLPHSAAQLPDAAELSAHAPVASWVAPGVEDDHAALRHALAQDPGADGEGPDALLAQVFGERAIGLAEQEVEELPIHQAERHQQGKITAAGVRGIRDACLAGERQLVQAGEKQAHRLFLQRIPRLRGGGLQERRRPLQEARLRLLRGQDAQCHPQCLSIMRRARRGAPRPPQRDHARR